MRLTSLQQLVDLYLDAAQVRKGAEAVNWLRPFSSAEVLVHFEERLQSTPHLRRNPDIGLRSELVQRIVIVGPPGSGKTALANQLSQQLGWPHVALEALYWSSGWKPAPTEVFRERTLQALNGETWIVDGNHWQVRDIVWGRADLLVWLNYSPWQTLWRIIRREKADLGNRYVPGSILLRAVRAWGTRSKEYPVSLSVNGMEQLTPKVIHLDSLGSAERWLSEFVASKKRQIAIEQPRVSASRDMAP